MKNEQSALSEESYHREEARQRAEMECQKWSAIFNAAPMGIWLGYADLQTEMANGELKHFLGIGEDADLGVGWDLGDWLTEESRDTMRTTLAGLQAGVDESGTLEMIDTQGGQIPIYYRIARFQTDPGATDDDYFLGFFLRMDYIARLEEHNQKQLQLLERTPQNILIIEACQDEAGGGRVLLANKAAKDLFGEATLKMRLSWDSPLMPDTPAATLNHWPQERAKTEVVSQFGEPIQMQKTVVPLAHNDHPPQFGIILTNIQGIERQHQQLLSLHEQLNQAQEKVLRGEVASIIGHDLQQPLYQLDHQQLTLAKLLEDDAEPGALKPRVEMMGQAIQEANAIVAGVRQYIRRGELEREYTQLGDVVTPIQGFLEQEWGWSIAVTTNQALPPISIDIKLVQVAIKNLVRNAFESLQATDLGDTEPCVCITLDRHAGYQRICITDNGPGFPAGEVTDTDAPIGTPPKSGDHLGMGIRIAETVVNNHGGALRLDNREEGGGSVSLLFPETAI